MGEMKRNGWLTRNRSIDYRFNSTVEGPALNQIYLLQAAEIALKVLYPKASTRQVQAVAAGPAAGVIRVRYETRADVVFKTSTDDICWSCNAP